MHSIGQFFTIVAVESSGGGREGSLYYRIVHIDPKHTTADIELSGDAKTDSST